MPALPLQPGIVYGPVLSRRLGRSLGVNLLPTTHKVCSFDCIYCQYGRTVEHTMHPKRSELPVVSEVLASVRKAILKPRTFETITFSGNGEPTLHPDFPEIVLGVKELRDQHRPSVKLALLSNASKMNDPTIVKTMELIDMPILKLDAGDDLTFIKINKPIGSVRFPEILKGLKRIKPVIIQSVLFDGKVSNAYGIAYESWVSAVSAIHPDKVQIYSTERPTASGKVECLIPEKLTQIQNDLQTRFNLNVKAFWGI